MHNSDLEKFWIRDGIWRPSVFVKRFLKQARARYPAPQNGNKAAWPEDEEGIAQNLSYFFTGHLLKISKILSDSLCDQETASYLSEAREITVIDMACGGGMASIGFLDFIRQSINAGFVSRETKLIVNFIVNDLHAPCADAAEKNILLANSLLREENCPLCVGGIQKCVASLSEIIPFLHDHQIRQFDFLFFCNAFDHVLLHGHRVLEKDPHSPDPLARARPCDRPPLLALLFQKLGAFANPYYSRNIFLQESRHSHLISVALPDKELEVTHTWMTQETDRPDIAAPTINVRFAYCVCKHGFFLEKTQLVRNLQPLRQMQSSEMKIA